MQPQSSCKTSYKNKLRMALTLPMEIWKRKDFMVTWQLLSLSLYIYIYHLFQISLKANKCGVGTNEGNDQNETWTPSKEMKLEWLYKLRYECELNSWPDGNLVVVDSNRTQAANFHSAALIRLPKALDKTRHRHQVRYNPLL